MDRFDFLAHCVAGSTWRTRDRREARITRVDPAARLIHGVVGMIGECAWRADGIYAESPLGAAGPLDLLPPAGGPLPPRKQVSAVAQLDGAARTFCCD